MKEVDLLVRKLERSKLARKEAEAILEKKALELFEANNKLVLLNQGLEKQIQERTRALSDSESRYRKIVENAGDFIFNINEEGFITFINEAGLDALGLKSSDYRSMQFINLVHDIDKERVADFYSNVINETINDSSIEFRVSENKRNIEWIEESVTLSTDTKGNLLFTGVARDVTEKKKYEIALQEAKEVAEKAQMAEKSFLANMSHEMRTPLNSIIGMAHLLEDDVRPDQRENLEILISSTNVLHSLIADVLDLSKIDAGKLELQKKEFDFESLVKELNKTFQVRVNSKEVKLHVEFDEQIDEYLIGDRMLLNQVLLNFVGNAVKFTQKGHVLLKIKRLQSTNDKMKVSILVEDTGIGIKEENLKGIFDRFKQANTTIKNTYGGTGLGLAISKQIIDLMEGELTVESVYGEGSRFSLILELGVSGKKIAKTASKKINKRNYSQVPHRVLVVEDNLVNQKYIGKVFEKWNMNFDFANDGLDAVEKILEKKYTLIFMDIQMPNMDGYSATRVIRGNENYKKTPIIALSASTLLSSLDEAKASGMTDFLTKPFNPNQIGNVVDKYILNIDKNEVKVAETINEKISSLISIDPDYLNDLYENIVEDAIEMFDVFLSISVKSFSDIKLLYSSGDMKGLKALVHKIKPTFQMVGLKQITDSFIRLEEFIKTEAFDKVEEMVLEFDDQREEIIQTIYNELKRLETIKLH